MSSDSGEEFDLDVVSGSESDFAPAAKKKIAPKAKAAPKSATKAKAPAKPKEPKADAKPKVARKPQAAKLGAKKKVPLKAIDENASADIDLDFGGMNEIGDDDDEPSPPTKASKAAPKDASDMYERLDAVEHILKRPDSYIGSIEHQHQTMWVFDSVTKRMVNRDVSYVPGFYKIVDEILVNAADNKINDPNMDTLKVTIDREKNSISVFNSGRGIPIEIHKKEKEYIPQLIFGSLYTSSNYDDAQKKLTGGRNGYGAKLANIYSHEFTVETADSNTGLKYKQTWTKNMSIRGEPKITKNPKGEEYTRVTFKPDLHRFGMTEIDDDTFAVLARRVYDMAGTVKDIKVFLNDERLKIKGFKQYVDLYINSVAEAAAEKSGGAAQPKMTVVYEQLNDRWEVAFALSEGQFQQVSFANSISTIKGGTHVDLVATQLANHLINAIGKKNKGAAVKPFQVKSHMWLFVNALIENAAFDSQTKDTLTLKAASFGTRPKVSEDFMKKVAKSGIVDNILNWAKFKADQAQKKTDGTKRSRLVGMAKLIDANNAGGRSASKCTLILCEGDSAKTLAEAGLSVVGRDNFGIFPLRGKLLNVREANHDQIMKNAEIQAIKKIMGLQHGKSYTTVDDLRYGSIMIMTDQDHDGSHIKGLLINFLDHFYPSLLKIPGFLVEFVTPIVRLTHKRDRHKKRVTFYTLPEYERWKEENEAEIDLWDSKYFKGLGTSGPEDAMDYFSHMETHMIPFHPTEDGEREMIDMAFSKKKADARKEWLRKFKPGTYIDHTVDEITYDDFINKELILFSMADNIRSIPSVVDGLKPGQRKVLFACFKRKLKGEIKVAQLGGYIGEHTAYHHGEQSLYSTIIGLAQDYVGANNLNLLFPSGGFGSRSMGGDDAASARYLNTSLMKITRAVFPPADDNCLNYLYDDDNQIEPDWYIPILPMVLVNGSSGIGTGWSTSIPNFNPVDIVNNIRHLMKGEPQEAMVPWYRGFIGTFEKTGEGKFTCHGIIRKIDDTTVEITELPIGRWTQKYKEMLEAWILGDDKTPSIIKDYKEYHTTRRIRFTVTLSEKDMARAEAEGLEKFFKLTEFFSTNNMMCFDHELKIKKYQSAEELIEDFYPLRLKYYQKRKDFLTNELMVQLERLMNQARFVKMIIDKEMTVSNRKKPDIVAELRKKNFKAFPKVKKAKAAGETEEVVEEEEEVEERGGLGDFDYLLGMAIWSLTREKVENLQRQCKTKEDEVTELLKLTPFDLWNRDLDSFLEEWEHLLEDDIQKLTAEQGKKKGKSATLKTRKSVPKARKKKGGSDDDDSEDDFRPTKAIAKPRKLVVKPVASIDVSDKPVRKAIAAPPKVDDSDIEMGDVSVPPKVKGKAKAAPKRKSSDVEESDDDMYIKSAKKTKIAAKPLDDYFGVIPTAAKGKPAAAPKKAPVKAKKVESEKEESDEESAPVSRPRRAARTTQPKYFEVDDDDDDDDDKQSVFEIDSD